LNILFWDIDGTLIRTAKAGLYAFEQATAEMWGKTVDFEHIKTAGMTDYYIATQIIQAVVGRNPTEAEIISLTQRYEQLLSIHLAKRQGCIMPCVESILVHLHERNNYMSLLLTGNSRTGAEIKLRHFGLYGYFDFSRSAFCDQQCERIEIARHALAIAQSISTETERPRIFVIGDTPHDVGCGKAIGAYTIGVATGTYAVEELRDCSPWWAVTALPSADKFTEKLESL
jgi:phosphoglycolate phosphatase